MTGPEFLELIRRFERGLRGAGAAVFYLFTGATFFVMQTKWHGVGAVLPDGNVAAIWDVMNSGSMLGLIVAFAGVGLLLNALARPATVLGLRGLESLRKKGSLTQEQFEIAKSVLLRDPSAQLVLAFLRSAEKASINRVGKPCLDGLRTYAQQLSRGI